MARLPAGTREIFVMHAIEEARLSGQFGGELPGDEFDSSITGERIVAHLLQCSVLSLREILKTLNHIKVMLLFYRSQLAPYVLSALVLATIRSVAREAYDSLENAEKASDAINLLLKQLGGANLRGNTLLEFVHDILFWCRQNAESELTNGQERGRDEDGILFSASDRLRISNRLARRDLVNYRIVREIIEMTATAKDHA